jgi:predicted RNA-binding Zn-ribbon protein involved in translation (DUF1610 family)
MNSPQAHATGAAREARTTGDRSDPHRAPGRPDDRLGHEDVRGQAHDDDRARAPEDAYEDGNALAGPLSEIFAPDVTSSVTHCAACGATGPLARLRLYGRAPGLVARCPDCGEVVLRMVRTRDAAWLDLRGTISLGIPLASP